MALEQEKQTLAAANAGDSAGDRRPGKPSRRGTRLEIPEPQPMRQLMLFSVEKPRGWRNPLLLFLATCASTFFAGASGWLPSAALGDAGAFKRALMQGWPQGLHYMLAVLAILFTHEMGHFVTTLWYRIPATYPLFIPVPFNSIGTMGAVIGMNGFNTHRRQLFDLGLSGPVAGLVVAIPIYCFGFSPLSRSLGGASDVIAFHNPLLGKWIMAIARPDLPRDATIGIEHLNPYFMAGWVGMLVTGLNMMPISQLDGGHVLYALFGRYAHRMARGFLVAAILAILIYETYIWTLMLVVVIFIGADHPPTENDSIRLDRARQVLGLASLAIPVLCFAPLGIEL